MMAKMALSVKVMPSLPATSSNENKASAQKEKIYRIDQYYSRKDRQIHYAKTTKENTRTKEKLRKYTLVIRRIINHRGLPEGVEIDIKSPKLAAVLKDIFQDADKLMLAESDKQPIISPDTLFLAWDSLEVRHAQESCSESPDTQLVEDLSMALAYLENDFSSKRSELKGLLEDGLITFELLGNLFTPNSAVYTDRNDLQEGQAMRFTSGSYGKNQAGEELYALQVSIITHDGEVLGWATSTIQLPFFEGKMKITELIVTPFKKNPAEKALRQELTDRGRKYLALLEQPVCQWYGATAIHTKRHGFDFEEMTFLASKRVVIDPPTWMVHNSSSDILRAPRVTNRSSNTLYRKSVKDEDLMFCDYRVLGFSFDEKQWGAFAVSKLQDPKWNNAALIRDLVRTHRSAPTDIEDSNGIEFDDIIDGKGRGLVGLLSGKPGLGKTLTAEAVSEVSHRPLYAVSAGELGTEVDVVDARLGQILDITRRWQCMLLIDEADVFLHKRDDDVSLERNALVSVFLRRLEYFQGAAILTTNRKLDIDTAFMSRIHYKFHYDDLDTSTRVSIWKNFLEPKDSFSGASIMDHDLRRLAEDYKLSGREIKNAAFCAKSISRARNEALSLQLVRDIIENLGLVPLSTATTGLKQNESVTPAHMGFKRAAADVDHGDTGQGADPSDGCRLVKKLKTT
ncbi:P-loop containing nucleoside triphosphate hydrolase protein [Byssothecium circinans]|uniref:P-loop containing nucleoside triphosphate hydrolase protein n=1 Tax=Byssothecium circinans TaxID=147558 RepID=A0A6A5TS86_9PLEO|nr:P-loop containing nucleoside triphosphate hydrolase protein [Byssothecium circinans]